MTSRSSVTSVYHIDAYHSGYLMLSYFHFSSAEVYLKPGKEIETEKKEDGSKAESVNGEF